ncbi:MAG TPA: hypothetical protein VGD66_09010 [Allosphingosinicella sp.]|jgi:hypothetical protein
MKLRGSFILFALLAAGCGRRFVEVDHPFYLGYFEDPDEVALFRCPRGPDEGCAVDGLPGPRVVAAGADRRFVVVHATQGYYYFARVPQETRGWGSNPERIVGPLGDADFERAKKALRLPDFTVRR